VGEGAPGTILTYFQRDPNHEPRAHLGVGQTHHFALAVKGEDTQLEWREKLLSKGYNVTPVKDRIYFKSIYTRDPDGHIIELATLGPGFLVDEDEPNLGRELRLPPWLELRRAEITQSLKPLQFEKLTQESSNE
jgi:glyoxalase family protein